MLTNTLEVHFKELFDQIGFMVVIESYCGQMGKLYNEGFEATGASCCIFELRVIGKQGKQSFNFVNAQLFVLNFNNLRLPCMVREWVRVEDTKVSFIDKISARVISKQGNFKISLR